MRSPCRHRQEWMLLESFFVPECGSVMAHVRGWSVTFPSRLPKAQWLIGVAEQAGFAMLCMWGRSNLTFQSGVLAPGHHARQMTPWCQNYLEIMLDRLKRWQCVVARTSSGHGFLYTTSPLLVMRSELNSSDIRLIWS